MYSEIWLVIWNTTLNYVHINITNEINTENLVNCIQGNLLNNEVIVLVGAVQ